MGYFPFFMDIEGKKGVIVGGGAVAARKAEKLRDFGPRLVAVSPEFCGAFRKIARTYPVSLVERSFEPEDLEGAAFVVAATDDGAVNGRISDWCRRRGVPVNVVDDREKCTFFFPALVKEGALTVGISTDGKCPAASAFLREQVVRCLPEGIGAVIDLLGQLRPEVAEGIDRQTDRAQAMEKLFLYSLRRGGEVTLQELRDLLHGMRQEGRRDG